VHVRLPVIGTKLRVIDSGLGNKLRAVNDVGAYTVISV